MLRRRYGWGLAGLSLLAAATFGATLLIGSAGLSPARALHTLLGGGDDFSRLIVWTVRLPRATAAFAVGALLALAGVLLQALFRNPLADPLIVGVSGGAAVGALAGMLAGASFLALHWYATAGGALVGLVVLMLGRGGGATRLLLCGVVFASACGALITVMLTLADNGHLRGMVFWLAGDLSWALSPRASVSAAILAALLGVVVARPLNVLASGEMRARAVGLDLPTWRTLIFIACAILTAIAVVSAGTVGFVGLITPHAVRLVFKTSDHRLVAPASALAGGTVLAAADLIARTIASPRQLPVGAIMAIVGAPIFLALLRSRSRNTH